ncbi:MAG: hypothetical protein U5O39_14555 [Gammaproteobacteria bacterium]|nr:hypothetical protein [Gammaproteobacteria bacterium]
METQRELFAAAIDIRQWLETDASRPIRERTSRDREIGREVRADRTADRVLEWWRRVGTDTSEGEGARLAALVSIANGMLLVAGVLTGLGIAGATFAYRGDHPVNLFALIGILVAVPLAMLMLQLTFVRSGAPLPASIRDALAVLSPARWAGTWLQRHLGLPLFESIASRSRSGFARWQLLVFSQSFAIGFFAGCS